MWPRLCSRVKLRKSEAESKRIEKDGSAGFGNLPPPKQINRVVALAFTKCIYIDNRRASARSEEVERYQRLVCLPFPSRRKGIQHERRRLCGDTRSEFINSAPGARATQSAGEFTPVRLVPGTHTQPRTSALSRCPLS